MDLYIDIETIPMVEPKPEDADIKVPKIYKKPEAIAEYIAQKTAGYLPSEIKKRSVDIYDNRIVCLGYAFNDEEAIGITGETEKEILTKFQEAILKFHKENGESPEGDTLIGHNIKNFDAPSIYLKACKYSLTTLQSMFYFGRKNMVDTMVLGAYFKFKTFVSMDNLCKYFGIEGKTGMDGSKVFGAWKDGQIDKIAAYCCDDVSKTRKLEKLLMPY